jgi:hypothetical protein
LLPHGLFHSPNAINLSLCNVHLRNLRKNPKRITGDKLNHYGRVRGLGGNPAGALVVLHFEMAYDNSQGLGQTWLPGDHTFGIAEGLKK